MAALFPPETFDLDPSRLWVMHCAEGPVPRASAAAVRELLSRELHPWEMRWKEDVVDGAGAARREAARLLGGAPEDISLTANTSSGLVAIAQGFPWQAGDEVVAPLGEYPTNSWPWLALAARGVSLRLVPLWEGHEAGREAWRSKPPELSCDPEQRLIDALGPKTRILTVSWVRFQDGLVLDLPRLARACAERGIALVVDGIQGAGTLPIPLEGLSAFATSGHKGLLAPAGQGFLWTAPGFRHQLAPQGSWLSVEECTNFARANTDLDRAWARDGTRLEQGGYNVLGLAALTASLATINAVGVVAIAAHVRRLQAALLGELSKLPAWRDEAERLRALLEAGRLGSILSLHHGTRGAPALMRSLDEGMAQGIYASVREGYLRIALHGFHTEGDIGRLVAWLATV